MIWIGILTSIGAIFLFYVTFFVADEDQQLGASIGFLLALYLFASIFLITESIYTSIQPIDVYRGKTTFEITYRDSVAVDSVVVWKEE
jgi:hypothetical protein